MFPTLSLGPLSIRTPGLLLLVGVFLGLSLAERHAARRGLSPDRLYSLILLITLTGLAGARLAFAAQHLAVFRAAPLGLLSLDPALLDPIGGLGTAVLAALLAGRRWRPAFWPTLDALTPALAVAAVFVGLAHLAAGSAFGAPTSLPWGIFLWGETRHPTQIYQTLGSGLILAGLWRQFGRSTPPGHLFLKFTALTAGGALLVEAFRADSVVLSGGLRQTQILAWIILAFSLGLLERRPTTSAESAGSPPTHSSQDRSLSQ